MPLQTEVTSERLTGMARYSDRVARMKATSSSVPMGRVVTSHTVSVVPAIM